MNWESRLRRLHEEATPDPWYSERPLRNDLAALASVRGYRVDSHSFSWKAGKYDAALIAELRNSLPAVLQLVENARELVTYLDGLGHPYHGIGAVTKELLAALDAEAGD